MPTDKILTDDERIKIKRDRDRIYREQHKEQIKARHKAWRAANKEKLAVWRRNYEAEHPGWQREYYAAVKRDPAKLEARRRYSRQSAAKPEHKQRQASYAKRHKQHIKAYKAAWHAANRDKHNATMRTHYQKNPEAYKLRTREWVKNNPEKSRASRITRDQRRRARKVAAVGNYKAKDIRALLLSQRGFCAGCGIDIREDYTVDHIMPLALGGSHDPTNIQLLCLACNVSKGALHPDDWAKKLGKLFI